MGLPLPTTGECRYLTLFTVLNHIWQVALATCWVTRALFLSKIEELMAGIR
jgi:hypothetical protein